MTTEQWRSVDRVVDNEISVEAENGDPRQVLGPAIGIREAGWEQVADWTRGVASSGAWPPDDQEVVVELSGAQWELVVECLARWGAVTSSGGNDIGAARLRSIRDLVVDQIAVQRPG
ncbi:hypothetical protein [Micromonospora thermarum]|uniref:Uncharacterized protein n=1 Tax=Micromonospora thermarum TaxID=2720024 RepID=A0ABX0Z513_9ACTN|nr:hypothetical protein [Micromonospora thermarum]NJP31055.1 hypothetical protein [Micromonospora thermarum]